MTERITFSFDGSFSGGLPRDPTCAAASRSARSASARAESNYRPGAIGRARFERAPGTFGTKDLGDRLRVVWHYQATDEQRTFTVTYRFTGLATAWDDVVDINLQVWGIGVGGAGGPAHRPPHRARRHPNRCSSGATRLRWRARPRSVPTGGLLRWRRRGVPAGQWVELRVAFSRDALESVRGARVREGEGLPEIRAEEERAAEQASRDAANTRLMMFGLIGLVALPAPLTWLFGYLRWGREPKVAYDREYEQEPPSDLPPALVGALRTQGVVGTPRVHRDPVRPDPQGCHLRPFGADRAQDLDGAPHRDGLRSRAVARHRGHCRPGGATGDGGDAEGARRRPGGDHGNAPPDQGRCAEPTQPRTRTSVGDPRTARRARAAHQVSSRRAGDDRHGAGVVAVGRSGWQPGSESGFSSVLVPAAIAVLVINAVLFFFIWAFRRAWVKRTPEGMLETERWEAFRRYLSRLLTARGGALDLARPLGAVPGLRHSLRHGRRGPGLGSAPCPRGAAPDAAPSTGTATRG